MIFVFVIVIIVILLIYYAETKPTVILAPKVEKFTDVAAAGTQDVAWKDVVQKSSLDPSIEESHSKYLANTKKWSSGANFSSIADDNTSGITTNWLGFSRPSYVEVDPTARQIPDFDTEVLKRNKRIKFVSDY